MFSARGSMLASARIRINKCLIDYILSDNPHNFPYLIDLISFHLLPKLGPVVACGLHRGVIEANEAVHFASQFQFTTGSITGPVFSRLHMWLTYSFPRSFTEQRDIGASIKLLTNWDVIDPNRQELPSASKINFGCCRHRVEPRFVGCTVVRGWLQSLRLTEIFFGAAKTAPGTFLRSRGSLGRIKFVNRSCSGVPSFRSNNLTFHPASNLKKSVFNMSSYRLNQESKATRLNAGPASVPNSGPTSCGPGISVVAAPKDARYSGIRVDSCLTGSKRNLGLLVTLSSPSDVKEILERAGSIQKANPMIRRLSEDRPLGARKLGHSSGETRNRLPPGTNSADPKLMTKPIVVTSHSDPESGPTKPAASPDSSSFSTT
ncbi:LOW QUALITY PROTEIN: hypothetical protein T265_13625 [Opisthorchis viverrini]|uniref:Uncharacterized protein n=1 Tax=Opisthorchis viverrini TaxID=6198 RepID=A0A074ZMC5_OPIVI|nr:LOW QUALITY PROTEIN: hypothetical protein T265_13625 [Opisthorchis viverrini]KER28206.1 LOW QUALITY PROTEIN: hypothetical protein T265_13625 [Opisthorchis viverrini]